MDLREKLTGLCTWKGIPVQEILLSSREIPKLSFQAPFSCLFVHHCISQGIWRMKRNPGCSVSRFAFLSLLQSPHLPLLSVCFHMTSSYTGFTAFPMSASLPGAARYLSISPTSPLNKGQQTRWLVYSHALADWQSSNSIRARALLPFSVMRSFKSSLSSAQQLIFRTLAVI